jgi:nucleoside-diphosphate-sugar epimerase
MKILMTGGAGYLGSVTSLALIEAGHSVRVIDDLLHGGRPLLPLLGHPRFEFVRGDIRDDTALATVLQGTNAVIHLAAIVGDPACARSPELARAVNESASVSLLSAAQTAGVERFVFASTCSNYGRMTDTSMLAAEDHELRPVSLYAETKVAFERKLLGQPPGTTTATVLRFATLFGLSPRMRFDLTVNQFVMEALTQRKLEVFGEHFWRPYVHVRDAARAIATVVGAPSDTVAGQVFNVGNTRQNYRKIDLVEIISRHVAGLDVRYVSVADDPRDYKVSFDRIGERLGYETTRSVEDGIQEIARAIESGILGSVDDPTYSNTPAKPQRDALATA